MPNWAEGYLRLKGKKADILNFISNETTYVGHRTGGFDLVEKPMNLGNVQNREEIYIPVSNQVFGDVYGNTVCATALYINGTSRNFIGEDVYLYFDDAKEIHTVVLDRFRAAWQLDYEPYVMFSKKYNIEIKIDVYESGLGFSQHMHAANGELVFRDERHYDDWEWECPCPNFGG